MPGGIELAAGIIVLLLVTSDNFALSEITAESVYELLSFSLLKLMTRLEKTDSRLANVEEKLQHIYNLPSGHHVGTVGESVQENKDITQRHIAPQILKAISDEKKLIRETLHDFHTKFGVFAGTLSQNVETIRDSLKKELLAINTSLEAKFEKLSGSTNFTVHSFSRDIDLVKKYVQFETVTHGRWSEWSEWNNCSSSCMKTRKRTCTNPPPSGNGQMCFGNSEDKELCNLTSCGLTPVHGGWSVWSDWGQCSATCNTGLQARRRTCTNPRPTNGGDQCLGDFTDYQLCNKTCEGTWSAWQAWSDCSASCGFGIKRRNRKCSSDQHCVGDAAEYDVCTEVACPVTHGGWSEWSEWNNCSSSCMKTRKRTCTNPQPSGNGQMCLGNSEDKEICNLTSCGLTPVHGGWSGWSDWGQCSATCNTGLQARRRTCTNPRPTNGGDQCLGDFTDYQLCNKTCEDSPRRSRYGSGYRTPRLPLWRSC